MSKRGDRMSKTASEYLQEANQIVPRVSSDEAIGYFDDPGTVFIDVRDSGDVAKTGSIKGATNINRGFIEFAADATTKFHNPVLEKSKRICVICAAGGQAALAGKTLKDMGYTTVINIGGFNDWKAAGGETE